MLTLFSTVALLFITIGWQKRKNKKWHILCMSVAFLIDLSLLIYIELNRHAIGTIQQHLQHSNPDSGIIYFHVAVSLCMLFLYLAQIGTGLTLAKGANQNPQLHRKLGITFVLFRLLNYVTSFFVPITLS